MSDPEEITIVVHSASGLQGKKPGRHKYSVIFGLGGTKFRTAVVKDPNGSPDWNEETVVHVSNVLDHVFFIATEKDDILGQITIPVSTLRAQKGQAKRTALQSHKKCPNPTGELVYQCYVSKYRPPGEHVPVIKQTNPSPDGVRSQSAFQRLRKRMASPATQRRMKNDSLNKENKENRGSLSNFNKKLSRSITDLFSFGKVNGLDDTEEKINTSYNKKSDKSKRTRKFSLGFLSVSNNLDQAGSDAVITSVTPNAGPIDRPTRVTIEGKNLGFGQSDIISLKIAGCDCTDTLKFESSTKLTCETHFWKVCKGDVVVDTISSGVATLKDGYTFYEELDSNENSTNPFDTDDQIDKTENESIQIDLGGKEIKSGSNTIPRIKSSSYKDPSEKSPVTSTPIPTPGTRYQKKHQRNNSETIIQASNQPPVEQVSKEQLMEKIAILQLENAALKKDNTEMKAYIDKLVAKCMIHCPEALAQDDDEKSKLFVL